MIPFANLLLPRFPFPPVQASGVAVAAECKESFEDVKKGKLHRYIIFYIEDEKMIKVECVGDRDADYDQVSYFGGDPRATSAK